MKLQWAIVQLLQLNSNQERDPCSFFTPFHQRRSAGACGLKQLTHLQTPSELLTEGQIQGKPRDWMPQWRIWSWLWWIWGHIHNMKSSPWASSTKALISLLPLWQWHCTYALHWVTDCCRLWFWGAGEKAERLSVGLEWLQPVLRCDLAWEV